MPRLKKRTSKRKPNPFDRSSEWVQELDNNPDKAFRWHQVGGSCGDIGQLSNESKALLAARTALHNGAIDFVNGKIKRKAFEAIAMEFGRAMIFYKTREKGAK